jgi:hypothetical protein
MRAPFLFISVFSNLTPTVSFHRMRKLIQMHGLIRSPLYISLEIELLKILDFIHLPQKCSLSLSLEGIDHTEMFST